MKPDIAVQRDARTPQKEILPSAERKKIEREIAITDEKIDDIVYELYGITDEERRIMEEKK